MPRPHPIRASRNPSGWPRPSEEGASRGSPLTGFYAEARDSKAAARERILFRLAKASGDEVVERGSTPVAPVSMSEFAALGNPLGNFLLDNQLFAALQRVGGAQSRDR